jgi:predicted DNA-binding protein (UPF0251 family)
MGRCKKRRCCRQLGLEKIFKPTNIPLYQLEKSEVELDEFEALRLCYLEKKSQIEAADIMEISRGTIQRLLNSGRSKIMDAFLNTKAIKINSREKEK